MRIVILGGSSQLAFAFHRILDQPSEVIGRPEFDLARRDPLPAEFSTSPPEVLINCSAFNFVDRAETEAAEAFRVNAWGVRRLARWCRAHDVKLVHFSTDYVFGGQGERIHPYTEDDLPCPINNYGRSKLAGEMLARSNCVNALVIRTSALFGPRMKAGGKGSNFVDTIVAKAHLGEPLRVVADQRVAPTFTADLAAATLELIRQGASGVYHLCNTGQCSWWELAVQAVQEAGMNVKVEPIPSSALSLAAKRPTMSVLANTRWCREGRTPLRPWPEALRAYLRTRP